MAVIALMEQEFVESAALIPVDEFVHSVGSRTGSGFVRSERGDLHRLSSVRHRAALLSAGAFLAPSIALVIILSDLYFRYPRHACFCRARWLDSLRF